VAFTIWSNWFFEYASSWVVVYPRAELFGKGKKDQVESRGVLLKKTEAWGGLPVSKTHHQKGVGQKSSCGEIEELLCGIGEKEAWRPA